MSAGWGSTMDAYSEGTRDRTCAARPTLGLLQIQFNEPNQRFMTWFSSGSNRTDVSQQPRDLTDSNREYSVVHE